MQERGIDSLIKSNNRDAQEWKWHTRVLRVHYVQISPARVVCDVPASFVLMSALGDGPCPHSKWLEEVKDGTVPFDQCALRPKEEGDSLFTVFGNDRNAKFNFVVDEEGWPICSECSNTVELEEVLANLPPSSDAHATLRRLEESVKALGPFPSRTPEEQRQWTDAQADFDERYIEADIPYKDRTDLTEKEKRDWERAIEAVNDAWAETVKTLPPRTTEQQKAWFEGRKAHGEMAELLFTQLKCAFPFVQLDQLKRYFGL